MDVLVLGVCDGNLVLRYRESFVRLVHGRLG